MTQLAAFFALIRMMLGAVIVQGPAPGTPPTLLYADSFNDIAIGAEDPDWCDHGTAFGAAPGSCTGTFAQVLEYPTQEHQRVYYLTPAVDFQEYRVSYTGAGASAWSGYELRADVWASTSRSLGVGVQSSTPDANGYYLLGSFNGQPWAISEGVPGAVHCNDTAIFTSLVGRWYHTKIRTAVVPATSVTVDACIWEEGYSELAYGSGKNQAVGGCGSCIDTAGLHEAGTILMWSMGFTGAAGRYIDNIQVNDL
jgi:hypothetical protein